MINLIDSYKLVIIRWATLVFPRIVLYIVYGVLCVSYAVILLYALCYIV